MALIEKRKQLLKSSSHHKVELQLKSPPKLKILQKLSSKENVVAIPPSVGNLNHLKLPQKHPAFERMPTAKVELNIKFKLASLKTSIMDVNRKGSVIV